MIITKNTIINLYYEEVERADAIVSISSWHHAPTGIEISRHKTAYGIATSHGLIKISKLFIGTDCKAKLRNTIRHEIAHLIAGTRQLHGSIWRHFYDKIGGYEDPDLIAAEAVTVASQVTHKYTLMARLEDGELVACGQFNRKHKKKERYMLSENSRAFYHIRGQKVRYFKYITNEE